MSDSPTCAACGGNPIRVLAGGLVEVCPACLGAPVHVAVEGVEGAAPSAGATVNVGWPPAPPEAPPDHAPPASRAPLVARLTATVVRLRQALRAAGSLFREETARLQAENLRQRAALDQAEADANRWRLEAEANVQAASLAQQEIRELVTELAVARAELQVLRAHGPRS